MARRSSRSQQGAQRGELTPFEGADVLQTSIKVTRAGDGLSDALAIDPAEYHLGDTVHVVLECTVAKVDYQPIPGVEALRRIHTLAAGTASIVDPEMVREVLDAQRLAIEQARGIERLPLGEGKATTDE